MAIDLHLIEKYCTFNWVKGCDLKTFSLRGNQISLEKHTYARTHAHTIANSV